MIPRFYTRWINVARLLVVLVILFNPVGPALAEALRADELSTPEIEALLFSKSASDFAEGFNLLTGGLDDTLGTVMGLVNQVGGLPLIGDRLADAMDPLLQMFQVLGIGSESGFVDIYRECEGKPDAVACFENGMYETFGPDGLGLLMDGIDAGGDVTVTDIVRSSGRDPNWVQYDMHLGVYEELPIPGFEFGANLGALGDMFKRFGFNIEASGLRAILTCDLYLGFGIHAQDGFYVTSNGVNQYGNEVEELKFSLEITAKPTEGDEPGISGDVALGALSTHVTDGTSARAQITAGEPLASAAVLTQTGGLPGSPIDYTRSFTLTLANSEGVTTTHPVSYSGFGEETFPEFLINLNTELMAATTGDYGPWPAVYALAYPRLNVSANITESIGGPVLIFRSTTPEVTAMEIEFDTGGDCVETASATNDLCAWGFKERQYEDTRSQGLGFSSGGQVGGSQIIADAQAPVDGILSTDASFNIWLTDSATAEKTRVPVLLRWMATNDDVESLDDLVDRFDAYLNGEGAIAGALSQNGITYTLAVTATQDAKLQLDCGSNCSEIKVDWDPFERSKLIAIAAVDITDTLYQGGWAMSNGPVRHDASPGRLTIAEMRQVEAFDDINAFKAKFAAEGNLRFHVVSNMEHISGFVEQGLGLSEGSLGLPEVTFDLKIDVTLKATVNDPDDGTGVSKDFASIQLDNVSLELGTLLDYVVKPMANILGWGLGPVFQVVGEGLEETQGFINEPIPLLDEIGPSFGIGQPSILDLTGNKDSLNAFFEAVKNLNSAVVGIAEFLETYDGGPIYFGCWEIDAKKPWPPLPCVVGEVMAKANAEATTVDDLTGMPGWNAATAGFSVDILKPENVIGLLMGSDVDIASFRLPHTDLSAGIDFGVDFDILAFDVDVGAGVELAEIGLVYDTTGLRTMVEAVRAGAMPDFGDLLDGFYLATGEDNGHDVRLYFDGYGHGEIGGIWEDWWGCEWGMEAGAEIELGGSFFLDVNDLNDDGKLRLDEMMTLTDNFRNPLNAFCLFDAGVNIYGGFDFWGKACFCACASLSASDFGLDSICQFDVSLSLSDILGPIIDCPTDDSHGPPPILATPILGCEQVLRINSGPFASQRLYGDTDDSDGAQFTIGPDAQGVTVSFLGGPPQVYEGSFDRVLIIGGEGNDQINVSSALTIPVTILGMEGDDTLTGGGARDLLNGGAGNDTINGGPGDDVIDGEDGDDTLNGDAGRDALQGGAGADELDGGDDNDLLYGGPVTDTLHGGAGDDVLYGGRGNDVLHGDAGDDVLNGNQGDDELNGGDGADRLYGSTQDDVLNGDAGDDILHGDSGTDTLNGGDDNDQLFGDGGFDTLNGDAGNDELYGHTGDDTLDGGIGDDQLHGDEGEDTLVDGAGNDALYGGPGDDRVGVHALLGDTWVQGDDGFDTLIYDNTEIETTPLTPTLTGETILANYSITTTGFISARIHVNSPVTDVIVITVTESFSAAVYTLVEAISVTLGDGDDGFVIAGPTLPLTMTTGGGNDTLTLDALSGPATINAGPSGSDTVLVHGTNGPTTIATMGADFDVVASSRANRLNLIQAALTVDGSGGGETRLLVRETGVTVNRPSVQLTSNTLTGLGASGVIGYNALDALVLDLGAGDDAVSAIGPSAASTAIDGGFGSNTLQLAPQSSTISRTVSTDHIRQVTLNNTASPADAAWTLSTSGVTTDVVTGTVEATTLNLTLFSARVDQATLNLGPGVDTVTIQDVPFTTTINGGGGGDQFHVGDALTTPIPLALNGQGGDDTLIVVQDDPGSLATPYTSLDFGAIEIVRVDSSASAAATDWTLDGSSLISAQAVQILDIAGRGVETVRIEEGSGAPDTLTWTNGPNGRMTVHGDAVEASASALEFSQVEALTLTTSAGVNDDTVVLRDVDAPMGNVTIHTKDGNDTVSVQKAGADQLTTISLGAGQDRFYLRELDTGSTTTVNGDGDDDTFRVNAVSLDSAVTISGGVGANALVFDPQGYTATMTLPATPAGTITLTNGPAEQLSYTGMGSAQILQDMPVVVITPTTPTAVGDAVVLAVSASIYPTGNVTYTWDLDGDGTFGDITPQAGAYTETVVFTVSWGAMQALGLGEAGEYVVTARATDSQPKSGEGSAVIVITANTARSGQVERLVTSSVWRRPATKVRPNRRGSSDPAMYAPDAVMDGDRTLTLLAVTYTGPGDGPLVENSPMTVTVVAAGAPTYTYRFDWYSDGTDVFSDSNSTGVGAATHVYTDDGVYTLVVEVSHGSGAVTDTLIVSETLTVKVDNVAPQFTISGGPDTRSEGQTYNLNIVGASGDPGPDTVISYTVSWGDGDVTTVASGTTALNHTYADDGEFFVAAAVRDEDGMFLAENTLSVTVTNIAPTLSLSDAGPVDEGTPYTLTLNVSDPGDDAINSWRVNWGDDIIETVGSGLTATLHTYADNGEYAISVTAADEDGTYPVSGTLTLTATIHDVAPNLSIAQSPDMETPVPEGAWYKLDLIACDDPGDDVLTSWTINWGDDIAATMAQGHRLAAMNRVNATTVITGNNPSQALHRFPEGPAVYTVTVVSASDEDGTYTSASKVCVEVSDTPPTITVQNPNVPLEGMPYTLTLKVIDPGMDLVDTWEIDWGDGEHTTIPGALDPAEHHTYAETHSVTATRYITTHLYPDNGVYAGSIMMTQDNGISVTADLSVTVRNVAPNIYLTGYPQQDASEPFTLTIGAVTDPGDDTVTEYRINWNDGSANETFTAPGDVTHTFQDSQNIHLIRASLVDEDIAGTGAGEYRSVGLLPVINRGARYEVPLSVNRVFTYPDIVTTPSDLDMGLLGALDRGVISDTLRQLFASHEITLSENATVAPVSYDPLVLDGAWQLVDAITLTVPITHVVVHTYTLEVHMDTPEYVSFAPLNVVFEYELDVHEEPDHILQFSSTDVITAQSENADIGVLDDLDRGGVVSDGLRQVFSDAISATLSLTATVTPLVEGSQWRLDDGDEAYTIIVKRIIPGYDSFGPADIALDYEISVYGGKSYRVDWGDGTSETYTVVDNYNIFSDVLPPPLERVSEHVLQLNAWHVYRNMGVYTVTFSVVVNAEQARAYHSYPVVVNYGKIYDTYLPLVVSDYAVAPDLLVKELVATTDNITVVIENQGSAPVGGGFWVQGYIDPDPIPDGVNQIWYYGYSDYGVSWGVDDVQLLSLTPGSALTLTLGDAYPSPYTRFPDSLPAGTPVYVQVDAYHPDTDHGAVLELDEILDSDYNNIAATVSIGGAGGISPSVGDERQPAVPQNLPSLPRFDSKRPPWGGEQKYVKIPYEHPTGWIAGLLPSIVREE